MQTQAWSPQMMTPLGTSHMGVCTCLALAWVPSSALGFLCADTKQRLASQSPKGQLSRLQR